MLLLKKHTTISGKRREPNISVCLLGHYKDFWEKSKNFCFFCFQYGSWRQIRCISSECLRTITRASSINIVFWLPLKSIRYFSGDSDKKVCRCVQRSLEFGKWIAVSWKGKKFFFILSPTTKISLYSKRSSASSRCAWEQYSPSSRISPKQNISL